MALREGNSALHWAATRPEDNTAPTAVAVGHFVQVTLMLLPGTRSSGKPLRVLLDCEPMLPDEDEVACGMRLLTRVLAAYPRAFDLVLADALYATWIMRGA